VPADVSFADFLRRIRAGDQQAAADLVRRYESAIRVQVRTSLTDPALSRFFDSMDICQSVLASFFLRVAAGEYDLESPQQLLRLLVAMTRNKVAFQARRQRRQRRDYRRVKPTSLEELDALANGLGPAQIIAGRDLLETFRARLSEQERRVADLRAEGHNWPEIAALLGDTAEACRKRFSRAIDRVAHDLGLEEE
jgi:RNA polymerase sigma-70 factor (ECF subfamily)